MLRPYQSPALEIQYALSGLGMLGNLMVIIVLSRKATNWSSYSIYLRCITIFNTFFLLCFTIQWAVKDMLDNAKCVFVAWTQTFPLACSIWITVALAFDRLFRRKKPITGWQSGKAAGVIAFGVVAVCALVVFLFSCSLKSGKTLEMEMSGADVEAKAKLSDMIQATEKIKDNWARKLDFYRHHHDRRKRDVGGQLYREGTTTKQIPRKSTTIIPTTRNPRNFPNTTTLSPRPGTPTGTVHRNMPYARLANQHGNVRPRGRHRMSKTTTKQTPYKHVSKPANIDNQHDGYQRRTPSNHGRKYQVKIRKPYQNRTATHRRRGKNTHGMSRSSFYGRNSRKTYPETLKHNSRFRSEHSRINGSQSNHRAPDMNFGNKAYAENVHLSSGISRNNPGSNMDQGRSGSQMLKMKVKPGMNHGNFMYPRNKHGRYNASHHVHVASDGNFGDPRTHKMNGQNVVYRRPQMAQTFGAYRRPQTAQMVGAKEFPKSVVNGQSLESSNIGSGTGALPPSMKNDNEQYNRNSGDGRYNSMNNVDGKHYENSNDSSSMNNGNRRLGAKVGNTGNNWNRGKVGYSKPNIGKIPFQHRTHYMKDTATNSRVNHQVRDINYAATDFDGTEHNGDNFPDYAHFPYSHIQDGNSENNWDNANTGSFGDYGHGTYFKEHGQGQHQTGMPGNVWHENSADDILGIHDDLDINSPWGNYEQHTEVPGNNWEERNYDHMTYPQYDTMYQYNENRISTYPPIHSTHHSYAKPATDDHQSMTSNVHYLNNGGHVSDNPNHHYSTHPYYQGYQASTLHHRSGVPSYSDAPIHTNSEAVDPAQQIRRAQNAIHLLEKLCSVFKDDHIPKPEWTDVLHKFQDMAMREKERLMRELEYLKSSDFMTTTETNDEMVKANFVNGIDTINKFLMQKMRLGRKYHRHRFFHRLHSFRKHHEHHEHHEYETMEDNKPLRIAHDLLDEFFALGWLERETVSNIVIGCCLNGIVPAFVVLITIGVEICHDSCRRKRDIVRGTNILHRNRHSTQKSKSTSDTSNVNQQVNTKQSLCRQNADATRKTDEKHADPPPPAYTEKAALAPNPEYCTLPFAEEPSVHETQPGSGKPNQTQSGPEYCTLPFREKPLIQENQPQSPKPVIYKDVHILIQPDRLVTDKQDAIKNYRSLWRVVRLICILHGLAVLLNALGDLSELIVLHSNVHSLPKILLALNYLSEAFWWYKDALLCSTFLMFLIGSAFFRSQLFSLFKCVKNGNQAPIRKP